MNFDAVWHAIESVLTFSILGGIGYLLALKGWFRGESHILLSRLVTVVALPPYLFYTIASTFTREEFLRQIYGSLVPFISVAAAFGISLLLAKFLRVSPERRGIFCSAFSFSNTIYIGLPVNLALFGEAALPYALLYYFASTLLFWTAGNYSISLDSPDGKTATLWSAKTLKSILSPPLMGFLLGLLTLFVGLPLPTFLTNTAKYLGALTTPLIIMSVGITLHGMGIRAIRINREIFCILLGRFLICPLIVITLSYLIPLPDLMRRVFIIQSSLPAMSTLAVMASYYKTDVEYATVAISTTTICSILTIPLFMLLMAVIF